MPDIWTHILFGEEVLTEMLHINIFDHKANSISNLESIAEINRSVNRPEMSEAHTLPSVIPTQIKGRLTNFIQLNAELFRFASQGPDFFFFYRFWPWKKTYGIDDIGRFIQNDLGGQFVHSGIQYLKMQQTGDILATGNSYPQTVDKSGDNYVESNEYQSLLTYMIGFICHYALDAATHPFIHHKTGIYRRKAPETHQYYGNHKIFEGLIDTILLQEKRGLKTATEPVYHQIYLGDSLPPSVLNFYQYQVGRLLDMNLKSEVFNNAYRDMIAAWKLFYDPRKHKYRFLKFVDFISVKKLRYFQFFYPHTVNNSVDYLNRNQKEWCHPADETEIYTTSFDQLWEQAKEWVKCWTYTMFQYLQDEISEQQLCQQIPNLSFSSGKRPDSGGEEDMCYFKPVVSFNDLHLRER